jgi:hypothetical protein
VHLAEREWEVLAEAEAANGPQSEDVHIHLPPDRLWIVRREANPGWNRPRHM